MNKNQTKEIVDYVYSRIGMALVSAQRVEVITTQVLEMLSKFDVNFYGITTDEFLWQAKKAKKRRKMLGEVFRLLKLNPRFVMSEMDDYLKKRNLLVHHLIMDYLQGFSKEQVKKTVEFCYDFGRLSDKVESFFKGFLYFLALRHVKDIYQPEFKPFLKFMKDFNYFTDVGLSRDKELGITN